MREDWIECKLEDLLNYEQPTKYIIQEEKYNDEFPTPVLTAGKSFIKGYTNEDFGIFDNLPTIIFDDFTTASQFVNFKFKVKSSAMKILVPTSKLVNLKYVFGAMQVNKVRSETHKRYWISEYSKLAIGLPPAVEQRAIVKKLESLFSSLDAGVADLKKAQQQLKIYRQAVLKKAFEGELTNKVVKNGLPDGWKIVKIVDLVDKDKNALKAGPFGSSLKKEFYTDEGYKIYGQEQVIKNNPYFGDYYVDEQKYNELYSCRIKPNDILISLVGTVGKVLLLPNDCAPGIINPRLVKITLDLKKYLPLFFKYYFESAFVKSFYSGETRGTTMDVLNLGIIKTIPFPLPHLDEQKAIVKQIESRLSVCDFIEQNIKESLIKAEALRQSILKKAFEGNLLTAQELAECKHTADYEPADVLLERIKAEHSKVSKPKKKTKTT